MEFFEKQLLKLISKVQFLNTPLLNLSATKNNFLKWQGRVALNVAAQSKLLWYRIYKEIWAATSRDITVTKEFCPSQPTISIASVALPSLADCNQTRVGCNVIPSPLLPCLRSQCWTGDLYSKRQIFKDLCFSNISKIKLLRKYKPVIWIPSCGVCLVDVFCCILREGF